MSSNTSTLDFSSQSYNFLFLSLGGSGHVNPQLALITELVQRGHTVSYICCEKFKAEIENTGARWVDNGYISPVIDFTQPPPGIDPAEIFPNIIVDTAIADLQAYDAHFQGERFDAIAYDSFTLAGIILSRKYTIPGIALWTTAVITETQAYAIAAQEPSRVASHWDITDKFLAQYEIYDVRPAEYLGEYNIAFIPRFFQEGGDDFPENFYFIGPSLGNRLGDDAWSLSVLAPDDSRPVLYISLGTVFNSDPEFYRKCIMAFADGTYRVIMSIGDKIPRDILGEIPDNFTVSASFPQTKVLSEADVFLSHAGMNSSMEGLYYEVPFVLHPQQNEQQNSADRLVKLGVGQLLSPDCDITEIRQKVGEVMENSRYKEKLAIYGPQARQAGGARKGAQIIEQIMHNM